MYVSQRTQSTASNGERNRLGDMTTRLLGIAWEVDVDQTVDSIKD